MLSLKIYNNSFQIRTTSMNIQLCAFHISFFAQDVFTDNYETIWLLPLNVTWRIAILVAEPKSGRLIMRQCNQPLGFGIQTMEG